MKEAMIKTFENVIIIIIFFTKLSFLGPHLQFLFVSDLGGDFL